MTFLIAGASHTGKTLLAQKLREQYKYPYLSLDLLKMGLIRSGNTALTPEDDEALEAYLWPIAREMIRTAMENRQNLIVEGSYIPFRWKEDFADAAENEIRDCCLVVSRRYMELHVAEIKKHASVIERRVNDAWCILDSVLEDNARTLELCRKYGCPFDLIDEEYRVEPDLRQLLP